MITDRIGGREVLLPNNHKDYNFRGKKKSQVMKKGNICILNDRLRRRKLFNIIALKDRKKARFRSLYTVSMVIETKVVIG